MSLGRYALVVLGVVTGTLALVSLALRESLGPAGLVAVFAGTGLAVANTVAAYALVIWSVKRSPRVFLGSLLGGMLARMAILLGAVAVGILQFGLPQTPLVVSLLGHFAGFLVLELAVVQKRTSLPEHL